jgi:hypothetical protein
MTFPNQKKKPPIDHADWLTMQDLKKAISFMRERNSDGGFSVCLAKDQRILQSFYDRVTVGVAA